MRAIGKMFDVLIRADVGLWYLLDLRRNSPESWIPVVLSAAILGALAVVFRLRDHNDLGAWISVALIFALLAAKVLAAGPQPRRAP